jgi:hypothetical protein
MPLYPKGLLMIPNTKDLDFRYFQSGLGLIYKWNSAFKPRFIFTCSLYLFDSKINDPYEQFQGGVKKLKYIFKDRNTKLPSRQELANIVSIAQLIHYGFEKYTRTTNELSISLRKQTVSKRWKECFSVDKKSRQLTEARKQVDPKKRIGKKYFFDLKKEPQRKRTRQINRNQRMLEKWKREWEILNRHVIEIEKLVQSKTFVGQSVFSSNNKTGLDVILRRKRDKRDILFYDIKRLQRTLENIDPNVQPDLEENRYSRFMDNEIKEAQAKTTYIDSNSGKHVELKYDPVDWNKNQSYNRNSSSKSIWVSDIPNPKLKN